jgi:hypothetical protein
MSTVSNEARALFVPLRREFFEAFAAGRKTDELRRYGPRWNERTCRIGRPVVLSLGYGKRQRIVGRVERFKKQHGSTFGSTYRASIERIYGTLDIDIACISIALEPTRQPPSPDQVNQP